MSVNRKTSQGKEIVAGLYPDTHVRLLNLGETNITNLQDGQDLLFDGAQWVNCFARVVVYYEDSFKGQTLEVYEESDPLDVVTTTLPTNANQITLYLRQSGHYHFSCTISGETYEDMADVGIAGNVYSVYINTAEIIEVTLHSIEGDMLTYTDADEIEKIAIFDNDSTTKVVEISVEQNGTTVTFHRILDETFIQTENVTPSTTDIYIVE